MRVGTVVQRRRAQICARLHAVQTAYSCAEWMDCSSHTCRRSGFVPHRRLRRERVSFSQMLADSGSRYDVDGPALSHALIQRARKRDSQQVRDTVDRFARLVNGLSISSGSRATPCTSWTTGLPGVGDWRSITPSASWVSSSATCPTWSFTSSIPAFALEG